MLLPFAFNNVEYIGFEEFSEIFGRNTDVDIVVDLHGNSGTVALSDTEAAGKNYVILDIMLFYCILDKLDDSIRALEMA